MSLATTALTNGAIKLLNPQGPDETAVVTAAVAADIALAKLELKKLLAKFVTAKHPELAAALNSVVDYV